MDKETMTSYFELLGKATSINQVTSTVISACKRAGVSISSIVLSDIKNQIHTELENCDVKGSLIYLLIQAEGKAALLEAEKRD